MTDMYIKNAADARKCIGQKVYWDDVGNRYIFLRSGILEGYEKRHVLIDGDYKLLTGLPGLRSFEMGGAWKRHKESARPITRLWPGRGGCFD